MEVGYRPGLSRLARDMAFRKQTFELASLLQILGLVPEGMKRADQMRWVGDKGRFRQVYIPALRTEDSQARFSTSTSRRSRVACVHAYRSFYQQLRKYGLRPDEIKLLDGESEAAQTKKLLDLLERSCDCPFDWTIDPAADLELLEEQLRGQKVHPVPNDWHPLEWTGHYQRLELIKEQLEKQKSKSQESQARDQGYMVRGQEVFIGYRYFQLRPWPGVPLVGPSGRDPWTAGPQYAVCTEGVDRPAGTLKQGLAATGHQLRFIHAQEILLYGARRLGVDPATGMAPTLPAQDGDDGEEKTKNDGMPERPLLFLDNKRWDQHLKCVRHLNMQMGDCGFYSFRDPKVVIDQYGYGILHEWTGRSVVKGEAWVLGQVALGGSVLRGQVMGVDQGARSSQARIEALWVASPLHEQNGWDVRAQDTAMTEMLSRFYECPVELFIRHEQFVEFVETHSLVMT